jgi:hypothetical protein
MSYLTVGQVQKVLDQLLEAGKAAPDYLVCVGNASPVMPDGSYAKAWLLDGSTLSVVDSDADAPKMVVFLKVKAES